jgi:hypothetical protein
MFARDTVWAETCGKEEGASGLSSRSDQMERDVKRMRRFLFALFLSVVLNRRGTV